MGLVALLLSTGPARADFGYEVTDLGTLGGRYSTAYGIDDRGGVVGQAETAFDPSLGYLSHAFVYRDGTMADLEPGGMVKPSVAYAIRRDGGAIVGQKLTESLTSRPYAIAFHDGSPLLSGYFSTALGINGLGHVVGFAAAMPGQGDHGFLIAGPSATDLGSLGGDTRAYAINDSDQVAGLSAGHAFVWQSGTMTDLGDATRAAYGINAQGQVVGEAEGGAFFWQGGHVRLLGAGVAYAINDRGIAVGASDHHAMLYADGRAIDLNAMVPGGYQLYEARGINSAGQIVANGDGPNGGHAFLLTPRNAVPEPSSAALLLAGAVGLAAASFGRRRARQPFHDLPRSRPYPGSKSGRPD